MEQDFLKKSQKVPAQIILDEPEFLPSYQTEGAAGADLYANLPDGDISLVAGERAIVDCGFCMALPAGWEAQIRARSGLAAKGLQVVNSPGTIDEDYRGRIKVILKNCGEETIEIKHKQRFAQMLLKPVWKFDWHVVQSLNETKRGESGMGSTGN
jgi:dUTP pyrophosphatase